MQYIKYNKVLVKPGKRDVSSKAILEFFRVVQTQKNKMKGFIVMDSSDDRSESIVLTFWETKEDMDEFYQKDNHLLSELVEKLKPYFEIMPERKSYQVIEFRF
jgi:heme-degrading monooxygenase HmoA